MRSITWLAARCLIGLDTLLLAVCVAWLWTPRFSGPVAEFIPVLLIVPVWVALLRYFGLYESHRVAGAGGVLRSLASTQSAGFLLFAALFLGAGKLDRIRELGHIAVASALVLGLPRLVLYGIVQRLRRRGFDARDVCVIGSWETAREIAARFAGRPDWGLRVKCVGVGDRMERRYCAYPSGALLERTLDALLRNHAIDEVLVAVVPDELADETATIRIFERSGVMCRVLLRPGAVESPETRIEPFCGELSLVVGPAEPRAGALLAKRAMDIAIGTTLLAVSAPLMAVAAVLIKLSSAGPVIFRQTRVGLNGRRFTMYKFRTMVEGAEQFLPSFAHRNVMQGPAFKDPDDARITPIGRVLRRFSLDELPQLINVLRGEMSLVGPRPLPVHEASAVSDGYRRRFRMKPGLTCLWQVNGRNNVKFAEWMKYDLDYVNGWSLWLDTKLLLKTIPAVLSGRGAY